MRAVSRVERGKAGRAGVQTVRWAVGHGSGWQRCTICSWRMNYDTTSRSPPPQGFHRT